MDPYEITLENLDVNSDKKQIIYLITTRDDDKNKLNLRIKNLSGAAVTFTSDKPLELSMGLPEDVIRAIQVDCEDGWASQPLTARGKVVGLRLAPKDAKTLQKDGSLSFTLTNIVFTQAEVDQGTRTVDFNVGYPVPSKGQFPIKMQLKPWAAVPNQLFNFEAAFIAVPRSQDPTEDWNVMVNDEREYLGDKANAAVFTNCAASRAIRTRLAFRLTNQDRMDALVLDEHSVLKIQFLAGDVEGALAEDLLGIQIKRLDTQGWVIQQATDAASPEWTLTPKDKVSLAPGGGSCEFLIDAVLPNGLPADNRGGPGITQMYVYYTKVPQRDGKGHYEDGYLAATIEKVVLEPEVPRIWISPPDQGLPHEINHAVTVNWRALGVETVQISYIDVDGKPQSVQKDWHGSMQVTPPAYPTARRTTTYQCTSGGGSAGCPVTVKSVLERYSNRRFEQVQYGPNSVSATDQAVPPPQEDLDWPFRMFDLGHAALTFTDDGSADLKVPFNRLGAPVIHASGTWWAMNSDNGNFSITFSLVLDEKSRKFETDPKTHLTFELPSATTFTLAGTCKGHDLTLGDIVASYDALWPTHATATGVDSNFCEVFCEAGKKWKLS